MQNGEGHFALGHRHVLLDDLSQNPTALLHDVKHGSPVLVHLKLELLGEAEQGNAACQDPPVVAGLQGIGDIVKECWPLLGVVKTANGDDTPHELLVDTIVNAVEHFADDVGAYVVLVVLVDDDEAEAGD